MELLINKVMYKTYSFTNQDWEPLFNYENFMRVYHVHEIRMDPASW